jgi:tRNA dimethylallyltransferase
MTKTEWDKKAIQNESPYEATILALDYRDRDILYTRIERRVDEMMTEGLAEEVSALLSEGYLTPESTAGGAIGYKELIGHCKGETSIEDASSAVKIATRHYAKRQLTWLRRNPSIHWLYPDDYETKENLFEAAFAIIEKTHES